MDCLKHRVKQKLKELYVSNWNEDVNELSKCLNYRIYKTEHKIESYFVKLSPVLCSYYNRFRCMNHRLPIEFGRFVNIERANRKCSICKSGELGDEFHFIFQCSVFRKGTKKHIASYFYKKPNALKFSE